MGPRMLIDGIEVTDPRSLERIERFWRGMWAVAGWRDRAWLEDEYRRAFGEDVAEVARRRREEHERDGRQDDGGMQ